MTEKIVNKEDLTFIGFSTNIRPEEGYVKCPQFWDEEFNGRFARLWRTMKPQNPLEEAVIRNGIGMFALCMCHGGDGFEYAIAGLYKGGEMPEGMKLFSYPAGAWVEFTTHGPLPESLQSLNTYIYNDWMKRDGNAGKVDADFMVEQYSPGFPRRPDYQCGIWIPLLKR